MKRELDDLKTARAEHERRIRDLEGLVKVVAGMWTALVGVIVLAYNLAKDWLKK